VFKQVRPGDPSPIGANFMVRYPFLRRPGESRGPVLASSTGPRLSPGRRSFLEYLWSALVAVIVAMASWGALRFSLFRGDEEKRREISPEVMQNINSDAPFHVASAGMWLRRDNQGKVTGLDDRCTHLGCRQKWNPERSIFECLCHGSEFDIHGNVLRGPAKKSIPVFALEITAEDKVRIFPKF